MIVYIFLENCCEHVKLLNETLYTLIIISVDTFMWSQDRAFILCFPYRVEHPYVWVGHCTEQSQDSGELSLHQHNIWNPITHGNISIYWPTNFVPFAIAMKYCFCQSIPCSKKTSLYKILFFCSYIL